MLLKLLLEVDKRVDRIAARTCVTWRSPWRRSVTTRCLFSLDTGHDTFSFSAAQLPPPPDGSRLENQCALTSTRTSVDVFIEFPTSPTGGTWVMTIKSHRGDLVDPAMPMKVPIIFLKEKVTWSLSRQSRAGQRSRDVPFHQSASDFFDAFKWTERRAGETIWRQLNLFECSLELTMFLCSRRRWRRVWCCSCRDWANWVPSPSSAVRHAPAPRRLVSNKANSR